MCNQEVSGCVRRRDMDALGISSYAIGWISPGWASRQGSLGKLGVLAPSDAFRCATIKLVLNGTLVGALP